MKRPCLVCKMTVDDSGVCTPEDAFATAYLMGLYASLACRSTPTTEMLVFLESVCKVHHPRAEAILDALIHDEADAVIRVALVNLHNAQSQKRATS